jgi:hypothetical protein
LALNWATTKWAAPVVSFPVHYVIVPFGGLFYALAARTFAPETLPELPELPELLPPPPLLLLLPLLPHAVSANAIAKTNATPSPRFISPPPTFPREPRRLGRHAERNDTRLPARRNSEPRSSQPLTSRQSKRGASPGKRGVHRRGACAPSPVREVPPRP